MIRYSVTYDSKNHMILITLKGLIDREAINKSRIEAARLAKQHNCFSVLADLREATSTISLMEIYDLPQTTSEVLSASGIQAHQFKRAIVVALDLDNASFFETVSRNRGHNVRLFRDMEEAKKWLSVK